MAVIDTKNNQGQAGGRRNAASQSDGADGGGTSGKGNSNDLSKGKIVDLSDKSLPTGPSMKLAVDEKGKPTEDAWEFAAPVPEGRYSIKLFLAKDPVTMKPLDKNNTDPNTDEVYYNIKIEGKLLDPESGTVFPTVSTLIWRGKNISTAAGLLAKLGFRVPNEVDHLTLAKHVVNAIKREPVVDVQIVWDGWSKEESRTVCKRMSDFPVDGDNPGHYLHIFDRRAANGMTEEIRAQLKVDHWYGKGEETLAAKGGVKTHPTPGGGPRPISAATVAGKPNGAVASVPQAQVAQPMVQQTLEPEEVQQVASSQGGVSSAQADDDLLAALEEA